MIKFTPFILSLIVFFLFAILSVYADSVILESLKSGTIIFKATGEGIYPNNSSLSLAMKKKVAKRIATVDAYRQLSEQVYGIEIDSKTEIKDFILQNDEVTTKVSGIIRGGRIIDVRYNREGVVEVDVIVELGKDFYSIIKQYME